MTESRRFDWRDHPGKVVLASPALFALAAIGISLVAERVFGPAVLFVFPVNAALATAGSAAGGLLVRGTTGERISAAIVAAVVGLFGYVLALLAVAVVIAMILKTWDSWRGLQ